MLKCTFLHPGADELERLHTPWVNVRRANERITINRYLRATWAAECELVLTMGNEKISGNTRQCKDGKVNIHPVFESILMDNNFHGHVG